MSKYLISDTILQDTADSLRAKLETESKIKPSEFASKIDDIVTNTGAFQVETVEEMNALTSMKVGDYCVVKGVPTYVMPQGDVVFSRYTKPAETLLTEDFGNYLWVVIANGATNNGRFSTNGTTYGRAGIATTLVNDSITLNTVNDTNSIFIFEKDGDKIKLKFLNGNYIYQTRSDYTPIDLTKTKSQSSYMTNIKRVELGASYAYNFIIRTSPSLTVDRGLNYSTTTSYQYTFNSKDYPATLKLYGCRLETTTIDHLVYKYNGTLWVDVTDDILVPQTTVTPTTSSQTPRIPDGYRGFKNITVNAIQTETKNVTPSTSAQTITPTAGSFISQVNVSAVDNTIDANIVADNIKKNITILGVTGTLDTGAYRVSSVQEMNALTDMKIGDYCVINPEGYTQLEYLESNGTEYIDTTILPFTKDTETGIVTKLKTEMMFQKPNTTQGLDTNEYVAGVYTPSYVKYYPAMYSNSTGNFGTYLVQKPARQSPYVVYGSYDTNIHKVVFNDPDRKIYFDGAEIESQLVFNFNSTARNTLKLFALDSDGVIQEFFTGRIYYTKMYNNNTGELVRDMIPVKRNSDNEIGMYDLVEGVYHPNLGTGAFTGGNTTNTYIVYQYDGTDWVDVTDDMLVPQTNVTPTTSSQTLLIPVGYRGFKNITVNPVAASIDPNIVAENIKKGVTILGITGTYEGIVPASEYEYQLETAKDIAGIQEQGGDE